MTGPVNRTISEMLADLAASEAELAAGQIVPGEVVMASIQAAIDRYEAGHTDDRQRKASPGR